MINVQPIPSLKDFTMVFAPLLKMKVFFLNLCVLYKHSQFGWWPGIRGTYQGLTATIMKQGSNQAIRFFVMETLKDWYRAGDSKKPVPKLVVGAFGAIAGAASVFGNTPIDVVKTRMQVVSFLLICTQIDSNTEYFPYLDFSRGWKHLSTKTQQIASCKYGRRKDQRLFTRALFLGWVVYVWM